MVKKAVKFLVKGTVQATSFRDFCKEKADFFNLRGYVRNLESGDIELFAEGDKEKIESFYEILKKGPPYAQIRDIKIEEKKWTGDFKEFSIMKF